jgi:hypothetical protein
LKGMRQVNEDYAKLIHYLEGMMNDGVQFVHGGQLFGWDDTNIPELLETIKQNKEAAKSTQYEAGDILKDKISGQTFAVIWIDEKSVQVIPTKNVLVYPEESVGLQFEKVVTKDSVKVTH